MKTKVAEKFDFKLSCKDVNVGALGKLVVQSHLDLLVLLFEEEIFSDNALLHDQVQDQIKQMKDQQSKMSALTVVQKDRKENKQARSGPAREETRKLEAEKKTNKKEERRN